MNWEIQVPYRDRSESLIDTAHHARHLAGDDAVVGRRIALAAAYSGLDLVGQLLDGLGQLTAAERLALVDAARTGAGLRSVESVEADERIQRATERARARAAATYGMPLRLAYREGGAIVDLDEVEADAAAERTRAATREAQRAAQRADRDADAQALRAHEVARDAQAQAELPQHLRAVSG